MADSWWPGPWLTHDSRAQAGYREASVELGRLLKEQIIHESERSVVPRQFRNSLYAFTVAVASPLLIGCGNVANLPLARATARKKEFR